LTDAGVALAVLAVMTLFALARVDTMGGVAQVPAVGTNQVRGGGPVGIEPRGPFGYDGQYFLRLTLEPLPTARDGFGVAFDEPAYRSQRVGYPALAWAVTAVTPAGAPLALLLVNLAAVAAAALLGARIARRYGRSPALGLALGVNPVTVQAVGRDTAEAVALALVAGAVLLAGARRPTAAGLALLAAALTRETTTLVVAGLGLALLADVARQRRFPCPGEVAMVAVPSIGWIGWQLYELRVWGELPVAAGDTRIGDPFLGIAGALKDALVTGIQLDDAAWLAVPLVAVLAAAALALRRSTAALGPRLAFVLTIVLLLCLTRPVWAYPAGWMRASMESLVLGLVILCANPWRALYAATAWVVVAAALLTMPAFVLLENGT
jgi:hypothetical protein